MMLNRIPRKFSNYIYTHDVKPCVACLFKYDYCDAHGPIAEARIA